MASSRTSPFWKIASVLVIVLALALAYWIVTRGAGEPGPSQETAQVEGDASLQLITWNLYNFGRSKDADEIAFMADLLRDADLVAIQEVSTGEAGAQAVARLDDELDRTGAAWDYIVSDPTTGDGSERYAYLWKPSRVQLVGRAWLEPSLADPIDREPYLARFELRSTGQQVLLASFHAVPRAKDPERENALLTQIHERYPGDNVLIMGDFNQAQDHEAFADLKQAGYAPILVDQKTSLRMRRRDGGDHLANEYDNIFFETQPLRAGDSGVIDFTTPFPTLREARTISDHLPVYMEVQWNE
jgi:endonuclease/exonuclease/phosphatase family metal-dependent hydrolase